MVVGSITSDHVEAPGVRLDRELGGSAAYFALAARHFGPVSVIGAVGEDREAELRATLGFADLSNLSVSRGPTAGWWARRARDDADAETLESFLGAYRGYRPLTTGSDAWPDTVFLGSCHPSIQLAVAEAAPAGALLAGDTMDVFIRDQRRLVGRVVERLHILTVTATELELLTRVRGLAMAAARALDSWPLRALVVKRGAQGVALFTREGHDRLRAFPVTVVDPTGAGDALAGAFLGRLQEAGGLSQAAMLEALGWGVVAASFAISAPGLRGLAATTREDLVRRLLEYRAFQGVLL